MADSDLPHLAERLNFLFAHLSRPGTNLRYTNDQAAAAIRESGGSTSGTYISQLRAGTRTNPSAALIQSLARLFDVPVGYFFDDAEAAKIQKELLTLTQLRDSRVRGVVARRVGVTDEGFLRALERALEEVRKEEEDERSAEPGQHNPNSPDQSRDT